MVRANKRCCRHGETTRVEIIHRGREWIVRLSCTGCGDFVDVANVATERIACNVVRSICSDLACPAPESLPA